MVTLVRLIVNVGQCTVSPLILAFLPLPFCLSPSPSSWPFSDLKFVSFKSGFYLCLLISFPPLYDQINFISHIFYTRAPLSGRPYHCVPCIDDKSYRLLLAKPLSFPSCTFHNCIIYLGILYLFIHYLSFLISSFKTIGVHYHTMKIGKRTTRWKIVKILS